MSIPNSIDMKRFIVIILLFSTFGLAAQNPGSSWSLEQLTDSALANYSIIKQSAMQSQMSALRTENINANFKPQLLLNGQMSYQSDVTQINIPIPNFKAPVLSQDWYKLNLDVTQMVYDGGITSQQKEIEKAGLFVELQSIEKQVYAYKEMIMKLYFRILLFDQQLKVLASTSKSLQSTIQQMESALTAGSILQSDLDELQVNFLGLQQKIIEAEAGRNATIDMLSAYTKIDLNQNDLFAIPAVQTNHIVMMNQRPELALFHGQLLKLDQLKLASTAKRRPIIQAFGQAGYGRPGLNMLDDNFTGYYVLGLRMSYKLWDWHATRNDKQLIQLQQSVVETQQQDFEQSVNAAFRAQLNQIEKYRRLIEKDDTIVTLQTSVLKTATSKFGAGVITSADYLTELEQLSKAQINKEINQIQLLNAIYEYKFITGNFNENE